MTSRSNRTVPNALVALIVTVLLSSVAVAISPNRDESVQLLTHDVILDQLARDSRTQTTSPDVIEAMMKGLLHRGQAATRVAPYASAPPCRFHNNRAFHTLWNKVEGCHYDHHHGDNPHEVDDIFGTSLFSLMGGEISHPWQTFSTAGYENDLKHAGYFWHVRRDLQPQPGQDRHPRQNAYIKAFRVLVHQHPSGRDAAVRFHSGVFEALVADVETGQEGYIQIPGMWVDFGHLLVDGKKAIDVGTTAEPGRHKQHHSYGTPQIIWYGASESTHTPDAPRPHSSRVRVDFHLDSRRVGLHVGRRSVSDR